LHSLGLCSRLQRIEAFEFAAAYGRCGRAAAEIVGVRIWAIDRDDQLAPAPISARVTTMRVEPGHGVAKTLDRGPQA